jgi:rsbT co-antagonist protein RsbR
MREMGLSEANIERRKQVVGLGPRDLENIASIKEVVLSRVDAFAALFIDYVASLEEGRVLVGDRSLVERARRLKKQHLVAMVHGTYDRAYAAQRIELALLYGRSALDIRLFLAAFQHLLEGMGDAIMSSSGYAPEKAFGAFMSLERVAFFDIGIMVDAIVFERERVIRQQQDAIRELSTPVLQIRERLLLLPIIGVIDTHRARLVTESLLKSIRANRAKVVVMDVTGVATIDSKVANHLIQTVTAARLMGAQVIVTGLTAEVAQSLVALGIDLAKLNTVGDLQGGMEEGERILGFQVVPSAERNRTAPNAAS